MVADNKKVAGRDDRLGYLPIIIAALVVVSDQATKVYIRSEFALETRLNVIPKFFDIVHVQNTGAAWGMMSKQTLLLSLISIVMLGLIIFFRRAILDNTWLHRITFALLVGGIIGNLIDRLKYQHVTDFLDFYIGDRHWPAFNIADSAICIAVGLYLVSSWRKPEETPHPVDEKA